MIAFLINEIDVRGGTHKQFLKLIEYTESHGLEYFIVTKKVNLEKTYPGFTKFIDKIRLVDLDKPMLFGRGSITRGIYTLRKAIKDADIINIHDNGFENYLLAFVGKKVIWQVNDLPPFFRLEKVFKIELTPDQRRFCKYLRYTSKVVDVFTVNVSKNRDRIKECFNRDASVLYCGIETVDIQRNLEFTFERFSNNKINILTSGVFFNYRNYETQIKVIANLRAIGIEAHLDIIGSIELSPDYYHKIKCLIEEEDLTDHVIIHGQVDEEKFKNLHKNSDIFVFINIDQSWGLAVFEAMSCGLPVIVSNSVGATEILTNRTNSLFIDPLDVEKICLIINELIRDKQFYTYISQNAKAFCNNYTWEKSYCSKMIELFSIGK